MTHPSQFQGKYVIQGKIHVLTGLHIGASDTGIEIGGLDNPVLKDPLTDKPYIPGSSLKGKLRSLTEWSFGLVKKHPKLQGFAAYDCQELQDPRGKAPDPVRWDHAYALARLFGPASDDSKTRAQAGPTRLTVRDAFLSEDSAQELQQVLGAGIFTEVKTENALDRVTSEATPRPIERTPAGAEFDFTLILDIYEDTDHELIHTLLSALALLEDATLGGGGSRGHGRVDVRGLSAVWRPIAYYTDGTSERPVAADLNRDVRTLAATFDVQEWL